MGMYCGFGINDVPKSRGTKEYILWINMINRCYSEDLHKRKPTYKGCEVSDYFKKLSSFSSWCQTQIGFNQPTFELDKDVLNKGNKEYHPDKCVFIPKEINSFLRTKKKMRGELPIGVSMDKRGNCVARMSINGRNAHIGTFKTPEQAFQAYKLAKENHIKLLAEKYRDQIDPRAYEALLNYKVEITD